MQPLNVVRHADQIPFSCNLIEALRKEVAKPHDRLDDAESRFDCAFPLGIYGFDLGAVIRSTSDCEKIEIKK